MNAKEGVKIYTTQSAFLRVLLKKHNISTYKTDFSSAGSWGLEEDFGLQLTGQLKNKNKNKNKNKKNYVKHSALGLQKINHLQL